MTEYTKSGSPRYAHTVHGQPNNNASDKAYRNSWANQTNASSSDCVAVPKGNITSTYSNKISKKTKSVTYYEETKPWTLAGNDFNLNIPCEAYITKITFTLKVKISGTISVDAPYALFNIYNNKTKPKDTIKDHTGWKDNRYFYNPNKKLSNSWKTIDYVMTGSDFHKANYPISSLNETVFGIDFRWFGAKKEHKTNTVSVAWIKCVVEYDLPNYKITARSLSQDINNPTLFTAGESRAILFDFLNDSKAGCCTKTFDIDVSLPPNTVVTGHSTNYSNGKWTVPCTSKATSLLSIGIKGYSYGEQTIILSSPEIGTKKYYIYNVPPDHDIGDVTPMPQIMQKGVTSCVIFDSVVNTTDGEAVYNIEMDTINDTDPDITWSIDYDYTSSDVVFNEEHENTNHKVYLKVPKETVTPIRFKGCFIPSFTGYSAVDVNIDGGAEGYAEYNVLDAPTFVVTNNPKTTEDDRTTYEFEATSSVIEFQTHRVATSTELGAFVIECTVAQDDASMQVNDCTLVGSIWEKIDYIGMIPIRYHHYDPESTYTNKGISNAYKNKVYKGKEGVIEEDITLKFKLKPYEATTLQGLIKLDKPTPINASHKCFEGDVLNHRGWVVLSEAKIKKTNPLWYDVDATVDYITHDINTKFQIFRGNPVCNFALPDLLYDEIELGDSLSNASDYFDVDTDGGYIYDEDSDSVKNLFSLDDGQHINIATKKALSNVSTFRMDWYTNLNSELKENKLSRVLRLKNKDGQSVFEYEYSNFDFTDDFFTCDVIVRVLNDTGAWDTYELPFVLKTELEADPIIVDDSTDDDFIDTVVVIDDDDDTSDDDDEDEDDYFEEDAYDSSWVAPTFDPSEYDLTQVYGTNLSMELNKNNVRIVDVGQNGRELDKNYDLITGEYYLEVDWINNNDDGTSEDIISYIDVALSETIVSATYEQLYGDLVVSPFPIPSKKVVFTRESEEGTIFYMTGEEPFKYRLEPYYQYQCGCDLVTRAGISIFDLNNSYTYYYIENGLVRLGFNKYNARMFLAKWDIVSKSWVTTHYFHMADGTIFSLQSYSDDKIVIKAGTDTLFTIFRGHPFIMVQNPTDSIYIDSQFSYCYSDKVDGDSYEFPLIWDFMNTDNLLPACIGGKSLDYDCITFEDDLLPTGNIHEVSVTVPSEVTALEDNVFTATVTPTSETGKVHFLVDGVDIGSSEYPFQITLSDFKESDSHTIQAVFVDDDDDDVAFSDVSTFKVNPPLAREGSDLDDKDDKTKTGHYALKIISAPKSMTYRDGSEVVVQLTKGGDAVKGITLEKQYPKNTGSDDTNAQGIVKLHNTAEQNVPGKYQWGARLWDNFDEDADKRLVYTALKWIEIKKGKITFSHNAGTAMKVNKGKNFIVKLKGAINREKYSALKGRKLTYTIDGGSKKTKKTNDKGNIAIAMNKKGTYKIKVTYAGSDYYESKSKTFTVKVV